MWSCELGEVENECSSYNFSFLAIFLPKIIKIGGNLTKFWQKQFCTVFLDTVYWNRFLHRELNPRPVTHSSANWARHIVTSLTEGKALSLCQTDQLSGLDLIISQSDTTTMKHTKHTARQAAMHTWAVQSSSHSVELRSRARTSPTCVLDSTPVDLISPLMSTHQTNYNNSQANTSNVTTITEVQSASFGLVLHAHHIFANSFLITWRLPVINFHSTCIFGIVLPFYVCVYVSLVWWYVAPPGGCYYNTVLCNAAHMHAVSLNCAKNI